MLTKTKCVIIIIIATGGSMEEMQANKLFLATK